MAAAALARFGEMSLIHGVPVAVAVGARQAAVPTSLLPLHMVLLSRL